MKRKYHSLADYLKHAKPKVTQEALAQRLGITPAYVSLLASGDRQPALRLALRIEAETGVPAEALLLSQRVAS